MVQFTVTKLCWVFNRVREWWCKTFWAFTITQQSVHIYNVFTILIGIGWENFWLNSQAAMTKSSIFFNSLDSAIKLSTFANKWIGYYCAEVLSQPSVVVTVLQKFFRVCFLVHLLHDKGCYTVYKNNHCHFFRPQLISAVPIILQINNSLCEKFRGNYFPAVENAFLR